MDPNPFTAVSGLSPKAFGGRSEEEKTFAESFNRARAGRCEHLVVLGDWGIGKTTLLRQFKLTAQTQKSRAAFIPIPQSSFENNPNRGITLIVEELLFAFPKKGTRLSRLGAVEVNILGTGGGVTLAEPADKSPQITLTECLLDLWKRERSENPIVVFIDDIQNFGGISEAVDTLRLVLQRDEIQSKTKFLFVITSTPDAWAAFTHKHNPVGRFFRARLPLERLNEASVREVIARSLHGTGVAFAPGLIPKIYEYCQGHPYELQVLCNALYDQQIGVHVSMAAWEPARIRALRELGFSHFESRITSASEQELKVLWAIANLSGDALSLADIRGAIPKFLSKYLDPAVVKKLEGGNLNPVLARLTTKGLLIKPDRGQYKIDDPMFRDYVLEVHSPRNE
jgi:uncharacterized protein